MTELKGELLNNAKLMNSRYRTIASSSFTPLQIFKQIQMIDGFLSHYLNAQQEHKGKGLVAKKKRKTIKVGRGLKRSPPFHVGKFAIDVEKLKRNVLCVRYILGKTVKLEIAMTDQTKQVVLELLCDKFNFDNYDQLAPNEKTVVAHLNNMLNLVDPDLLPSPTDEMYTRFNVMRGELMSGNDSMEIKRELKKLAFELHKLKKINGPQLRNIIFEVDGR